MNTTFFRIGIVFLVSVVLTHVYLMNLSLTWRNSAPTKSLSHFHVKTSQVGTPNVILSEIPNNQDSIFTRSNQLVFRDLAVLILACNRQNALDYALLSLSRSYYSDQTSIYVSVDCMPGVRVDAERMKVFFKTITIWNSKQRFKKEEGEMARRKDERVTRHWVEAVTKVLEIHTHVLYMEEDHIVHPSILRDAFSLLAYQEENCSTCFSVQMGCHADCWGMKNTDSRHIVRMEPGNMGVIYSREKWQWFLNYYLKELCTYYGSWDILMHHILFKSNHFMHSLTYLNPRLIHHNLCTSDRTSALLHCDVNQLKVVFEKFTSQKIGLMHGGALGDGLIDYGIARFSNMIIPEKSLSIADKLISDRCMQSISSPIPQTSRIPPPTPTTPKANASPIHILMWKPSHIDWFWGAGHSVKMQSLANKCSNRCVFHLDMDSVKRTNKGNDLDVLLLYAGTPAFADNLWQEWLDSKQATRHSVVWNTESDDNIETALRHKREHLRISYSFDPDIDTSQACDGLLQVQKMLLTLEDHQDNALVLKSMKSKGVAAMISNCNAEFRNAFVTTFMQTLHVDQHGQCFHNVATESNRWNANWQTLKSDIFKDYQFALTLENKKKFGYISEKIFDALSSRCIPIYWGTDEIYKYVPADKFIMVNETSFNDTIAKVQEIQQNETLYESFHKWDMKALNKKIENLKCKIHPLCQLCELF